MEKLMRKADIEGIASSAMLPRNDMLTRTVIARRYDEAISGFFHQHGLDQYYEEGIDKLDSSKIVDTIYNKHIL